MSFDLLAPHYTWMEKVLAGSRLQRCRTAWINALDGAENILIAGVGHGHFLRTCVQRFPAARITCVDASAGMLVRAERRARNAGARMEQLSFIHSALPAWRPAAGEFDLLATHFFFDCFPPEELRSVIGVLANGATQNARWLVTDFAVPQRGLARHRAKAVHALMYGFFRRVTQIRARRLTDPDPLLITEGFTLTRRRTAEWGLLCSDLWVRMEACDRHIPAASRSKT